MMRFVFVIVYSLLSFSLGATIFKGKITNEKGDPIPYATVYIEETAQGIVSDDHGEFQITLEKGTYHFIVSSLGHEKNSMTVTIPGNASPTAIVLQEKIYQLNEVTIRAGGEDPAYPIMRKAIIMAPFYLNQVKLYQANIYLKGTLKVDKIPALIKRQIKDPRLKSAENKLFLIESQNDVKFTAPNKYDQKVIALSTTIPVELDNDIAMGVINSNIYAPDIMGIISPLAPNAFSHYQYKLEGITLEDDHLINKIKVIPKKKNAQLMRGYVYIVENLWNVQHADLSASQSGVTVQFNIAYHEVRPGAFLPTSYDMKMKMDVMGMKGEAKYYSSIQYKEVDVNSQYTPAPFKTIEASVVKESKQLVKARKKLKSQDLEIKPRDSVFTITHDTFSLLRDSIYWLEVRQLSLQPDEIISYRIKDSLKIVGDSLKKADSIQHRTFSTWTIRVLTGEKIKFNNIYTLGYDGLLRACPEYNFVDGFWLGQQVSFGVDFDQKKNLTIRPSVHYLTARKGVTWKVENSFKYDPMRHGNLSVTIGNTTEDYAGTNGTSRLNNSFASLFFASNTAMFYQKKFINVMHGVDLAHAFRFTVHTNYEKRNTLRNNTSYSFFGGRPKPNYPGQFRDAMPAHGSFVAGTSLQYTPRYHFHVWKGEKFYVYSDYPTFTLTYERGIPLEKGDASFDRMEANIKQQIRLNTFNLLRYNLNAGIYFSSETVYLPDYKHFGINELFITNRPIHNRFNLLNNYTYVTKDKWLHGDIEWDSDYMMLKHIPFMQSYLIDEALHLRSLWIPGRNYTEFGYSIGFGEIARVGVFAGLENGKYDAFGCTVSLPVVLMILGRK